MSNDVVPSSAPGRLGTIGAGALDWMIAHNRLVLAMAGVGLVALLALVVLGGPGEAGVSDAAVAVVERGRLVISLTETGTIRAKNNKEIKCEVEGQSTISFIVPEGIRVKKGDLLVELDSSDLQERLDREKMSAIDAKAAYENAVHNLDITKSKNESSIAKAQQDLRFAEMDLEKWEKSERALEAQQAETDIKFAEAERKRAADKFEDTSQLFEREFVSRNEYEADKLEKERREAEYEIAAKRKELDEQYTWLKREETLKTAVEEARRELERAQSEAAANLAQAEAELTKRQTQLKIQEDRLAKVQMQIEKTKIHAPQDGLVVYPQTNWRNPQVMEVGTQVRHRQDLLTLPDLSELIVATKVYESWVSKVAIGQRARIKVTALAQGSNNGEAPVLNGEVTKIAVMPDYQNRWMGAEQKTFTVEVTVKETNQEILAKLKPEMSADVTIILDTIDDALHVPIQAVTRDGDVAVAYRVEGGRAQRVPVEVGASSNTRVQILSGLQAGDKVLLYPPITPDANVQALGLPGTGLEDKEPPAGTEQPAPGSQPPAAPAPTGGVQAPHAGQRPQASELSQEQREQMRQRSGGASSEERGRRGQRPAGAGAEGRRPSGTRGGGGE